MGFDEGAVIGGALEIRLPQQRIALLAVVGLDVAPAVASVVVVWKTSIFLPAVLPFLFLIPDASDSHPGKF